MGGTKKTGQDSQPKEGKTKSTSKQQSDDISSNAAASGDDWVGAESEGPSFVRRMAEEALKIALKTGITTLGKASNLVRSPETLRMLAEAGESLRDTREVAGLTRDELAEALDLTDKGLVEAVENGTATLSFDLILRLSSLLARHDPIPFVMKYARTYNPDVWKLMEAWGAARLTIQYERERQFINIMRRHDAARKLSDEGFAEVLKFTRASFEMALHFVAEQENVEDEIIDPDEHIPSSD